MGEVGMEMEFVPEEEEKSQKEEEGKDGSSEVVQWERFLPRMVLRVLLVEADDSTRQIIAALLRKCSYKVAAVADGLMAWETLKGRPHNIDLILTEVELPSISGFALLTLVMEHDICKNIPVIMMSSQDSISMVLKCMLKGAADFLIKPVRRNELRNLWQHVWRRYTLAGGNVPQSLPDVQHKVEATAENNAESNQSSDYASSTQKIKEGSDKRSDTQSSCTTPYLEAESTYMQSMQGLPQPKCRSADFSNAGTEEQENCIKQNEQSLLPANQTKEKSNKLGTEVAHCSEATKPNGLKLEEDHAFRKVRPQHEVVGLESDRGKNNPTVGAHDCNGLVESSSGAIDLIGSFDKPSKGTLVHSYSNDSTNRLEFAPQLELSLRRSFPSSLKNQGAGDRHTLNHSDASAFSRYAGSKTLQPLYPTLASKCTALKEGESKLSEQLPNKVLENAIGTSSHAVASSDSRENVTTSVIVKTGQSELRFPSPQGGLVHVRGVRLDNMSTGCGHAFPTVVYSQSGLPPAWSSKPAAQRDHSPFPMSTSVHSNPDVHDSEKGCRLSEEIINCSRDQAVYEQNNQEPLEDLRCSSPAAGQSACSSLCNGAVNHESSSAYGGVSSRSDASASLAAGAEKAGAMESFNDSSFFIHDGSKGMVSHRTSQREAALTKFRLKRKDRCFEKKVRYQSRKRLAEQRPRVRGQFVRQVQNDATVGDADGPKG